ncbi:MAG TPA: ABC transporter permease [Puia sp.]|nr:ABC transporter permease [Puia sp.]
MNKHRLFSFVNIFGLALGIAAFWLITLYVADEFSYDRYHKNAGRIFRVVQHGKWGNGSFDLAITSAPYAAALKADYPSVEAVTRIDPEGGGKIGYGDKQLAVPDIVTADSSIFRIFSYHFLAGDPADALAGPHKIVLTRTMALKFFPSAADAEGKTIVFDRNNPVTVTGVIEDIPANSHLTFSALRSFNLNDAGRWTDANLFTYVLLRNATDAAAIEAQSKAFYNKYLKTDLPGVNFRMELQPLTSIHLHSHLQFEAGKNGNITYVYVFSIVALLVLGIAIINYINLTTARATTRVREVGIRKVIGSGRKELFYLFVSESTLFCFLATLLALMIVRFALPYFNQLSGKQLGIAYFGRLRSALVFGAFGLVAGLLSGIYPALFLSGFKAVPAMKGQMGNQSATILFRKSLVVFQFAVTIVLITGSAVMYQQLHFVLNRDLGFNKSQMLTFHLPDRQARARMDALKTRLLQSPLVVSAASAGNPIGNNDIGETSFNLGADGNPGPETRIVEQLIIDEDFIPAMQIRMYQGRNFLKGVGDSARHAIIINRTLADELGWKNPVGVRVRTGVDHGVVEYSTIVGVVEDFNTYSLQHRIAPMELVLPQVAADKDNVYVRLSGLDVPQAIRHLRAVFHDFDPGDELDYHFLDQNFAAQYAAEEKQGSLVLIFTGLAIGIACLGLFGLVTFTAAQRLKEIGIRKVLGAGAIHIVRLLTGEMVLLVLVAALIAAPIAWFAMHRWLQTFAYRTGLHWWVFAGAGVVAALVALATMGVRSVQAAMANPAKSLNAE